MSKDQLIETGRRWLEHAPPATQSANGLVGWRGGVDVCADCASRIIGRGCDLSMLASKPVWQPGEITCDLCEKNND